MKNLVHMRTVGKRAEREEEHILQSQKGNISCLAGVSGESTLTTLRDMLPDWQVLLYLGYESHGGVRASVHSSQDCYDHKKPGGRASRIYPCYHTVLEEERDSF